MEFKKPTILVVDDMTTTLLLLHDLLKDTYEVKIAKSGTKALEILESPNDIDLILLDIEMPDINGYEVCKILKNMFFWYYLLFSSALTRPTAPLSRKR